MISDFSIQGVPVSCIQIASVVYRVPATYILAVLHVEGGKTGMMHRNHDGSIDYGQMQVNTRWLSQLSVYGYTAQKLQWDACANLMAGVWILSRNIADAKDYWQGIGNYHSHTKMLNASYRKKVQRYYAKLLEELSNV